jgi:hypothetical protein
MGGKNIHLALTGYLICFQADDDKRRSRSVMELQYVSEVGSFHPVIGHEGP